MNSRRLFTVSYLVLLAAFVVAAGAWFAEAHAEYRQLKLTEAAHEQSLADARKRLAEQQKILQRMRTDPVFVEKVIRERLKFVRPGEVVFRFED